MITVFFSRKSAGKSTLAAQMASKIASGGQSVVIVDTDPQGTISNWSVYRKDHENAPKISMVFIKMKQIKAAVTQMRTKFDHIIIDLEGGDSKENREAILLADKLVMPFKPSQPDLDNIRYVSEMLEGLRKLKPEIETYLVINEAPFSRAKVPEVAQAREYFETYELHPIESVIHSRKAYRDSMALGLGACELKDKKAKEEIDSLWTEIYKKGRLSKANSRQQAAKSTHRAPKKKQA